MEVNSFQLSLLYQMVQHLTVCSQLLVVLHCVGLEHVSVEFLEA